jgi:hypothetical protein
MRAFRNWRNKTRVERAALAILSAHWDSRCFMKIHCIALTKNEEDVVCYCLTEAAQWADHIYVYDTGSTDATWDIVKSLESDEIVPWKHDGKVFSEGLRAEVFNEYQTFFR